MSKFLDKSQKEILSEKIKLRILKYYKHSDEKIETFNLECLDVIYYSMEKEIVRLLMNISRFRKGKENGSKSKESLSEPFTFNDYWLQNNLKRRKVSHKFSLQDLLDCCIINPSMIPNKRWAEAIKSRAARKNPQRPGTDVSD